ncbi:metallophosphoesterase [Archangium violaceum]|uniref:purple acid phosphatase family protein n=1 Tax=Archangium violaceum TaxID=83451 RepID=UPI00194DD3D3|nr:metallophosphoesterase family protein [Archangium violaceum]QRO00570.1 metallophosphoesterase [Archangium violaceum]
MHRLYSLALGAVTAALTLTASSACADGLARQPYLQRVGPETATVAFRLDAPCVPTVLYGTNGSTDQTAQSADTGRNHAVVLAGLQPGTEYTYLVDACGARTNPVRFSTAPVPGTRNVHFTAVGDFGMNNADQRSVATAMLGRKPDLFVMLGDNAYSSGTETEIQNNLFAPMAPLLSQVPFFATPGNHEYVTNQAQPYFDNLYLPTSPSGGERYYSFDWGHIHFVSLDSNCAIGLASSDRCSLAAQKKWVEQDLAASTAPWKIVFFHHPPWSSGEHGSQLLMRREFSPLFEKYGVDLVLNGHDHHYERMYPMQGNDVAASSTQSPTYLVVGSGGASLRRFDNGKPSWTVLRNDADHGYLDVKVEEGTLTAQMLTPSGKVIDSFSLSKDLPPLEQRPDGTPDAEQPADPTPAPQPGSSTDGTGTGLPSTPGTPDTSSEDGDLGEPQPEVAGCSAGPVMALLPAGAVLLAGALRRRRRR